MLPDNFIPVYLITAMLIFFIIGTLHLGGAINLGDVIGPEDMPGIMESEPITKTVTIKDKTEIDGVRLVYTTDREIYLLDNVFLYREIEVNGTYFIEYNPVSPGVVLNVYCVDGQIISLEAVWDA